MGTKKKDRDERRRAVAVERDRQEALRREALENARERWERYRRALRAFAEATFPPRQPLLPEASDLWLSPAEKQRQRFWIEFRPAVRPRRRGFGAVLLALSLMDVGLEGR